MTAAHPSDLAWARQLFDTGNYGRAEHACRAVLAQSRRSFDAHLLLAEVLYARALFFDAEEAIETCIRLKPMDGSLRFMASRVCYHLGDLDRAMERYQQARHMRGGETLPRAWPATILIGQRKYDDARALLRAEVEAGRADVEMAAELIRVERAANRLDDALEIGLRYAERTDASPEAQRGLLFELGSLYESRGDFDAAWETYVRANGIGARPFDERAYIERMDRVIAEYSPQSMPSLARSADRSEIPVFIAAMPRTGTTLVEQIIDAHPNAYGAGELTELDVIAADLPTTIGSRCEFPACIADLTPSSAAGAGKPYLSRLACLARRFKKDGGAVERVVNKSVTAYRLLGLVEQLFPGARVVHVSRNPLDTCLSCFALPLPAAYTSDLRSLGVVYRQYERLMAHWKAVLTIPVLDLRYEDVIANPEAHTRTLIEFLGLPWDERCLRSHQTGRRTVTHSQLQVAKPVYATSMGRHIHFEKYLGPLREALGMTSHGDDLLGQGRQT